ncbi:MAG: exopolysaccharide biosynthesis polyprenyl glycosylphosphotransferase [Anaerolineae bacterium]
MSERRLLLMFGDTLCVTLAGFIALYVWSTRATVEFTSEFVIEQLYLFVGLIGLWLLIAGANDFFELSVAANRMVSLQKLSLITLQMLVIYLLVFFFSPRDALPRLFIVYYGVASFILLMAWRLVNPALIGWASTRRRILIIGADASAQTLIEAIREHGTEAYEICGIIGGPDDVGKVICDVPVIGAGNDLLNFVRRDRIRELVITAIPDMGGDVFRSVMKAYEDGVALVPMPIVYERITGRVPVRHVNNNWAVVLPIDAQSSFDPYPVFQRMLDIVFGLLGLIVFLVLLPFLALAIRLDSRGSIFYGQTRTGLNGRNFRIFKFRSMIQDAEAKTGPVFSNRHDPRITRIGHFMRRTRLDELPQVVNVLRGDMSIVGPRPERPEHIDRLTQEIPFYRTRLVVRPGLTGWAQVRYDYGSNDVDALVKLEYDLYYIRNQSILLDLNIIVRTVGKVVRMAGV